jgi:hypothetical protein
MNGFRSMASTKSRFPVVARFIVPLLGVFFLVHPIRTLLQADFNPALSLFALGAATYFAGVFLRLMLTREPPQLVKAGPSQVFKVRVAIAFLAVLAGAPADAEASRSPK